MWNDSGIDIVTDSVFVYRQAAANARFAACLPAGRPALCCPETSGSPINEVY